MPHLIAHENGRHIDLGHVKPDSVKINGTSATVEEFAEALRIIRWDAPLVCEECGHGQE